MSPAEYRALIAQKFSDERDQDAIVAQFAEYQEFQGTVAPMFRRLFDESPR